MLNWFRKIEPIDYITSCICCGCSIIDQKEVVKNSNHDFIEPMKAIISTKEILMTMEFSNYISEFIEYKFGKSINGDVVLKWVSTPTDGINLYSTPESDYNNTTRLLYFLKVKFDRARRCNEKE